MYVFSFAIFSSIEQIPVLNDTKTSIEFYEKRNISLNTARFGNLSIFWKVFIDFRVFMSS